MSAERRAGELDARELLRWTWRQLTSMRTALMLLLLLALAAIPGSVIPQEGVDSLAVTRWKNEHPKLTPVYEKLDLFAVYSSPWFSAIYLLLALSLVGCIVPRLMVYYRALRAEPPAAPRHLTRLPVHASYDTTMPAEAVLDRARAVLGRRHRLRASAEGDDFVAAERGYVREAGNLVFHLSVLIVLAGFAVGGLWGYQGGSIIVVGSTFSNNLTQYDDFKPGGLFRQEQMQDFRFTVDKFDVDWLKEGPRAGQARKFQATLSYHETKNGPEKTYDLRVNHPLEIDGTDVFLIGHGYAPVVTVRDAEGNVTYTGPTPFLPQDASFLSFGVIKPPVSKPAQLGLEGLFYPSFDMRNGDPVTVFGDDLNPTLSMLAYTGDLGVESGRSQSVYVLDKTDAKLVEKDGKPVRVDLQPGDTFDLPDDLGSVTFDRVDPWIRVQISQTPGKDVALVGVVLALIGLCLSLFIRPRRVWVRAVPGTMDGDGGTRVEVAVLDRSGNGDMDEILKALLGQLKEEPR